ncbi:hypothetical protein WJX81_004050 [Elliptochloris bilobata]|uniref:Protein disulfide-isomerase n=1 Tax=Elliptochloris bilobata TaxID=381761 RepID=A0AAW1RNJ8_9CHLO
MNLAAVRARGEDLRRTLDQVILTLQHHPDHVQWAEALDHFSVLSVQLASLAEQLRPLARLYAAHPRAVNAGNAATLPIMLATRALPEMEAKQAALLAAHRAAAGALPLGAQYEATGVQMELVNALVDSLTVHAADKPVSGALDPKGPVRRELAQQLRAALAAPAKRQAGAVVRDAKRGPGAALLAAVTRGEALALAAQAKVVEEVVTLDGEKAFDKAVAESTLLVAEFYAPWCGHCKNLAPEYEKAAKELKGKGSEVVLAKVDATLDENKPLATRYGVGGFPTLKIFRNGKVDAPSDYNGPREAAGIVSYLEKVSGPASAELKTAKEVAAFRKKDLALLGAFAADSPELAAFLAAAEAMREDFDCAHVLDASLLAEAKAAPAAVLLKSFDEPVTEYSGDFTEAALTQWALAHSEPVLVEMDQTVRNKRSLQRIFADQTRPKFLAVVPKGHKAESKLRAEMTAAAGDAANKEKLSFLWVDPATAPQVGKFFGLEDADYPAFAIHDQASDGKFLSRSVKAGSVKKYVKDFLGGKLEKTIKSEPVPASNDGPVKVLVADQFNELVIDTSKSVLIEFYAPWCGHCQSLAPVYEQVGEAFAGNDKVLIAKMDATANDIPSSFKVQGFPTLFFYNGKTKEVVSYEGNRSLEDLVEFVSLHSGEAAPTAAAPEGAPELERAGAHGDEDEAKDEL